MFYLANIKKYNGWLYEIFEIQRVNGACNFSNQFVFHFVIILNSCFTVIK